MSQGVLELGTYTTAIDTFLARLFPTDAHPLYMMARESVVKGGRRIRATLALLGCEALSGDYRPALPMAAAYELAHSAALIQDDILDKAALRRGLQTTWSEHGIDRAILTMDIVLFTIPSIIAQYVRTRLPRNRLDQLLEMLGKSSRDAALGEYMDLQLAERATVPLNDYLEMARLKTGSLLAAPAACGAIIGGGTAKQVRALYEFGEALGTAYQIVDDIIDLTGSQEKTGKPSLNDLKNGKFNTVIAIAFEALERGGRTSDTNFIKSLRGREIPQEERSKLKRILVESGTLGKADKLAATITSNAQEALEKVVGSDAARKLLELSAYVSRRAE